MHMCQRCLFGRFELNGPEGPIELAAKKVAALLAGRGIASLKAYLEYQVTAGALKPHDCEIAAA